MASLKINNLNEIILRSFWPNIMLMNSGHQSWGKKTVLSQSLLAIFFQTWYRLFILQSSPHLLGFCGFWHFRYFPFFYITAIQLADTRLSLFSPQLLELLLSPTVCCSDWHQWVTDSPRFSVCLVLPPNDFNLLKIRLTRSEHSKLKSHN